MSLPELNLDDKTFEELVEEVKKHIPVYAPEWTDHNIHDPGITFVELFAWLAEMQLYSLNRITDKHLLKFLRLLGTKPLPATPSKVDVQFTSDDFKTIPARKLLKAILPSSEIVFEIDEEVKIIPLELKEVLRYSNYQCTDIEKSNESEKIHYDALGDHPEKGDTLYLGLDSHKDESDLKDKKVKLGVYLYEEDLPPEGQHGEEKLKAYPSVKVRWEFWDGNEWSQLDVEALDENIIVLSESGHISFDIPGLIKKGKPPELIDRCKITEELFWIKCKLLQEGYEIPPRIKTILLNVHTVTQGQKDEKSLGKSNGLPYQVFEIEKIPIVPQSYEISIDGEKWVEVDDFDASDRRDKHYVIDLAKGEIHFGDGIKGCVPPKDAEIRTNYRYGGGAKGNVGAGTVTKVNVPDLKVSNPFPAQGGKDREDIDGAFIRFRKDLKVPYQAVTAKDFEYVALNTPGLRVSRAKAVVKPENTVIVVVVPYSLLEKPIPSEGFKKTICKHLDLHRLITTYLEVQNPDYVRISVNTEIRIKPGYSSVEVSDRVNNALTKHLSPIKRKPDYNEWPFGRPVFRSEIYEVIENVEGVDCVLEISLNALEGEFKYKNGDIEIGSLSLVYSGKHNIEVFEPQIVCK